MVWMDSRLMNTSTLGGGHTPTPQGQKLLCCGPFQASPYVCLNQTVHLYSSINWQTSVSLSSVSCFSKVIEPKEEVIGIYSQLVRRTGDNMGLWLATKAHTHVCVCVCVELRRWGKQSCGAEALICGVWHYLQADGVRIPLNCRTPSWCPRELPMYIHVKSLSCANSLWPHGL